MARRSNPKKKKKKVVSDYDGAWKSGLCSHFRSMLTTYFPAMAAEVDWRVEPVWRDRELQRALSGRGRGRRPKSVDLLAEVRLHSGQAQGILMHVEVQSRREPAFEARVARYYCGLRWGFELPVVSLVILADLDADWKPTEHVFALAGFECRVRFEVCKLIEHLETDWKDEQSLPVALARAQVEALQTVRDFAGRYRLKLQLVRSLYTRGYNSETVREAFRLIDWMMQLPEDLDERFEQELGAFEEQMQMPYVTSVERIAEARGREVGRAEGEARGREVGRAEGEARGREKGRAEGEARGEARGRAEGAMRVLQHILRRSFGRLPVSIERRLRGLSADDLETLAGASLEFKDLKDLKTWLDEHHHS